jgi:hypothetical protein
LFDLGFKKLLKKPQVAPILGQLFSTKMFALLNLTNYRLGYIFGGFFTKTSGHPDANEEKK